MTFSLLGEALAPAEGETTVRTYFCTSLSSWLLSLKAQGYLTVTNKRVVFYASGSSFAGKSVLHSEVPIADVSGITSFKGTYLSFFHLLVGLVLSFISLSVVSAVVGGLISILFVRNFQGIGTAQAVALILGLVLVIGSFSVSRESILRSVLAASSVGLFGLTGSLGVVSGIFGGLGGGSNSSIGTVLGPIGVLVAGVYTLVCLLWYSRRPTLSLSIGSKGGANTPIAISGMSGFGLHNTAALSALTAEPADDAELMIKELGAMITDIQALGDFGVMKWKTALAR